MRLQANPDEETTDWRAVCGRTARTVQRAGKGASPFSTPISRSLTYPAVELEPEADG